MHFKRYESMYLGLIRKIRDDIYVDDLVTGEKACMILSLKNSNFIELFKKGGFKLHKWHSNEPNLETNNLSSKNKLSFAKEHVGTKANETTILGLNLDKQRNSFRVQKPMQSPCLTKRNKFKTLASIYDPLGFILSVLLICKILFRNRCDLRIP